MSRPSPSPASSRRASCRATTRSRTRPRSSTTCSASSRSPTSRATTSPMSIPTESTSTRSARASTKARQPEPATQATKYLSKGLTRSRTDNLVVMRGGSAAEPRRASGRRHRDGLPRRHRSARGDTRRRRHRAEAGSRSTICRRPKSSKRCNGARPASAQPPQPHRPRPSAAPRRKPRATRARCAASAATSRWCATAPA